MVMWTLLYGYVINIPTTVIIESFSESRHLQVWQPYEGCPESTRPYWISRELVAWPWCNLAASQKRPYCASVNSHCLVGLVSWQWDALNWACVLCNLCIHKSPPFEWQFYLWEKPEVTGSQIWAVGGLTDLGDVMLFQKKKSLHESCRMGRVIVVMKLIYSLVIVNATVTQYTTQSTASHCQLTSPMGEGLFTDAQ